MNYDATAAPVISKHSSYHCDRPNQRIVFSTSGKVILLNCNPDVFEEVVGYVDGKRTFKDIERMFSDRYPIEDVEFFLQTILDEGVISVPYCDEKESPKFLVIGEGILADYIKCDTKLSIDSFLRYDFVQSLNFDMAIIAPSECSYGTILSVNKKLYSYEKPFTQISFNGDTISIGPLVVPNKSACLECAVSSKLNSINTNAKVINSSAVEIHVSDLSSLLYSYVLPQELRESIAYYACDEVVNDLTAHHNGLASEILDSHFLLGTQSTFKSSFFLSSINESVVPSTRCAFCNAINKNYIKIDSKTEIVPKNYLSDKSRRLKASDVKYQVGGYRSLVESETKILVDRELTKLGASVKIIRVDVNSFNDIIPCFATFFEQTNLRSIPFLFRKEYSYGKGMTELQSYFSAVFELFESLATQYTGDIPIVSAKYVDVKEYAVDVPYMASRIMNDNTAFEKFDENVEMDWVVATSLSANELKLVPAFLVFWTDVELKGSLFGSSSTGDASAATLEDAVLHGIFEYIERDSWLIGQSNPYILPLVDYETSANVALKETIEKIKEKGYDVVVRDYTTDIGIPVFRAWIVNKNDYTLYACNGFGCHTSPEIALERSITEAIQAYDKIDRMSYINVDQSFLCESLVNLYNQHYLVNKDILGTTDRVTKIGASLFEFTSSYDILKKVTTMVNEKTNGDIYYVPLTKAGIDIEVVKIFISGDIQYWNHPILSVSKRMYEFGARCGYSNKNTTYEELFMGPYQH